MQESVTLEDLPQFMEEARTMARRLLLRPQFRDVSLQTTELVDTALRRLAPPEGDLRNVTWQHPDHFLGTLYQAMLHALCDHCRKHTAGKRDKRLTVHLEEFQWYNLLRAVEETPEQVVALGEALARLAERHPQWATVAQHRLLGGLTMQEIAEAMGESLSTVQRAWKQARLWLGKEIRGHFNEPEDPGYEKA